jgi:preprotein translocase subunit SecA
MLQMKKIQHQVLNAKYHQKEAEIVANAGKAGTVTIATNMAGRGTDIKLGEGVKEAGGLAIIGTERHDSRRVDRQLRGRAGRQGDPGSSRFFVSLEDDLMRKFGSERIASIMDRMGLKEGEVITAGMVSKSIERAQKKVEENNFGMRKNLLEYDDVMSAQRKAIYRKRRNALYGDRLDIDIDNMFYDLCENTVATYSKVSYQEFELELLRLIGIETPVDEATFKQLNAAELTERVYATLRETYDRKCEKIARMAYPQVKHVFETMSQQYKNIVFPLTDGRRQMQLIVNLEEAYQSEGRAISKYFERNVLLSKIDDEWKEHLREMDDLRTAVRNAQYEQKDPLVIYKLESYELFRNMLMRLNEEALDLLMRMDVPLEQQIQSTNQEDHQNNYDKAQTSNQEAIANSAPAAPEVEKKQPVVVEQKINRNDPCPCGSGKKFKQCHGQ